jgi:Cytochrome c, mono- and diheme variants
MKRRIVLAVIALAIPALVLLSRLRVEDGTGGEAPPPLFADTANEVERGRALVLLADCGPCHTARGGEPFAGGRAIPTPFGTFVTPNITPDPETGIGNWTSDDFWRALHEGRSRDGRLLYPTFPYTNYTKISRRDADAMFAYLRTLKPVRRENRPHELRFPYDQRWLLAAWRALFFRPGVYEPDPERSAEWNRGAYLVQGVAHCSACHEARNALGAIQSSDNPAGGLVLDWYAPSLTRAREAGVQHWSEEDIVTFLRTGRTQSAPHASALGPMAEVVYESLQHVHPGELHAMAVYLKSLPVDGAPPDAGAGFASAPLTGSLARGREIYMEHCADCHGERGEGRLPAAIPLAGNRAVCMDSVANPIRIVLYGGYPPGTEGSPRPFGMPPFYPTLRNDQIASVLNYVRTGCGADVPRVTADEVERNRGGPLW